MYVPAYLVAAACWVGALRRVRSRFSEETIPAVAVLSAAAFVLMMIQIPIPGGASAHASGVAVLAVRLGVPVAFLSVSTVLLLQSFAFGIGGVTSLPLNALAMGLAGAWAARAVFLLLGRRNERLALVLSGWAGMIVSAALLALALGLQPGLAHGEDGRPLFFPFGPGIVLPAVLIPHALLGVGEGVLTALIYPWVKSRAVPEAGR
jgi:cobalt/nickel transport system permease protein